MIELNSHIQKLLSENDIAIIPHFGGFLAHYIPAIRDSKNHLFIPPKRTIGFNEQLRLNDGMLIQSYMREKQVDLQEADLLMKADILKIKNSLEENGYVKFDGIGTIYCDSNNQYSFEEQAESFDCPLFFGMKSFEMLELSELQRVEKNHAKDIKSHKPHAIHDYIGGVVVLAIIIASFFVFSSPIEESAKISKENYAKILPIKIWDEPATEALNTQAEDSLQLDTENFNAEVAQAEVAATAANNEVIVEEIQPLVQQQDYHVIVASLIPLDKAEILVKELQEKGYTTAQILTKGGKRRVSLSAYTTNDEAIQALNNNIHTHFPSAWILKVK